jgi:hypothetical protein
MRKARLATLLALPVAVIAIASSPAVAGGQPFTTALSGANEVSGTGVPGVGDPDASGTAKLTINRGQGTICWSIDVENISSFAAAHIHNAPAGANGPIVVHLDEGSGCEEVGTELAKTIAKNPANYYVNVHSSEFPAGAVRGQLG